jgi:hypothetical protein
VKGGIGRSISNGEGKHISRVNVFYSEDKSVLSIIEGNH